MHILLCGIVLWCATDTEEQSEELQKTTRAHQILVAEQKAVLSRAVDGFATVLGGMGSCLSEEAWNARSSWGKKEWEAVETWGWFRHFCRSVSPFFRLYVVRALKLLGYSMRRT